jgi:SAM-dependent methyltransferase
MFGRSGERLGDGRWMTGAAERNREPILGVLRRVLPPTGVVLEIASGAGQHVAHFAKALPSLTWQPTDPDAAARDSIRAWIAHETLTNVRDPIPLDVTRPPWPVPQADAIVCINMIHIAPWAAAEALVAGARDLLPPAGVVFLYGPYRRGGQHTAASNEAFDARLRADNPAWGVRDLEAVLDLAATAGFAPAEIVEMPANNLSVVLTRRSGG